MFNNLSIKARLFGLVVATVIGFLTVIGLTYSFNSRLQVNGPIYNKLSARRLIQAEYEPPALCIQTGMLHLTESLIAKDDAESRGSLDLYRKDEAKFRSRQSYWRTNLWQGPVRECLERDVYPPAEEFIRLANSGFIPLIEKGEKQAAQEFLATKLRPVYMQHMKGIDQVLAVGTERITFEETAAEKEITTGNWTVLGLSLGTLGLISLLGWWLAQNISRSTKLLQDRVDEMASGASDLTARIAVARKDELGHLAEGINGMISKIQSVVSKVRQSSLQVLSAASQIAATARQQESTVQNLNSATTEIAAAVREISATGKELSGTMSEVNNRADQAASLASSGRERLASMESTMQQLVESTASISSKLSVIREKADNITSVVTTITKVADQTNLLSINAAIEAEKAGEYGRGFLVVAREIRRLADQTAVATLDIGTMVRLMQDAVSAGVMQMDKFSDEVRSGVGRVAEINGQTGQIITEVSGLSDRFRFVNEGMRNQSMGAEQINEAMGSISNNVRDTASALEEFNRATSHLRTSIEQLNQEIGSFKV